MVSVLYTTVVIVSHFSPLVCSVECEGSGVSLAGILVLGVMLIIVSISGLIYIIRRSKHRNHLIEEHAKELFAVLVRFPTLRQLGARLARLRLGSSG